jgi:hypothetical protein
VSKEARPKSQPSPAVLFGGRIQAAIGDGAAVDTLVLRLTLNDGRRLRRDDAVPLEQISYLGGQMHFLGVRVIEGGVTISVLEGVEPT